MELLFLALLLIIMASTLASGYPVAFALPGAAISTIGLAALTGYLFAGDTSAYFASGGPVQWLSAGVTNFRGIYWEVERDTLIAIPLFIFMGIMLQRSKIAQDLLVTMAQLFGQMPGGLGVSVVFVGALLAATTGIVGATVVAMGLISLPAMSRSKYDPALATGTIAASGTLGQIIPPSIVLIILADQLSSAVDQADTARKALYKASTGAFSMPSELSITSTSAGDMFLGALVPGLLLVALYMIYILAYARWRPEAAPAVPFAGRYDRQFALQLALALLPPLALIFIVLGSIILGVATVNQAGAIGAIGASVMAGYRLMEGQKGAFTPALLAIAALLAIGIITSLASTNIKGDGNPVAIALAVLAVLVFLYAIAWSLWRTYWIDDTLRSVMVETAKTTSLVFIILLGAAMLTAAFRAFGGEELVKDFLTGLPGGFWVQFIIVMAVIFVLGFFLDFIEIAVVVVPIVAPILLLDPGANVTAVWLGVMIGLNIQTSFLTPPFGFALFYLRGVAPPDIKTVQMYKGVVPFIGLQLLALVVVGVMPQLVNYLPNRIQLLSQTAPPPLNPRLQYCMEDALFASYRQDGDTLIAAIARARLLDMSMLPKKLRADLTTALDKAGTTFGLVSDITKRELELAIATPAYRPLHQQVRRIEKERRAVAVQIRQLEREQRDAARAARTATRRDKIFADADVAKRSSQLQALKKQDAHLQAGVPSEWNRRYTTYASLQQAADKARASYRRNVDGAYEPVRNIRKLILAADQLALLRDELAGLHQAVTDENLTTARVRIKQVIRDINRVAGTTKLRRALRKARKALRRKSANRARVTGRALRYLQQAQRAFDKELAWRQRAKLSLLTGLGRYEAAIRNTIGLRQQERLPSAMALHIASCKSHHRDMSLRF